MMPLTANASSVEAQYQAAIEAVSAPQFGAATACQKQAIFWDFISGTPYDPLPSAHTSQLQTFSRLLSRSFLKQSFVLNDDVRLPRIKAFHAFGTAAKVNFVADGNHPFTGIFATGAAGIARASLAVGMPDYSPAISFKFLLDGPHPSQNLLLHQSLDPQSSRDFFERSQCNRTLIPSIFPTSLVTPMLRFWLTSVSDPFEHQLLDHLADVTSDGTRISHPVAPELVNLYSPDEVHNDPGSTEDFRTLLGEIPSGTLIYRMYGRITKKAAPIYIGSITTESAFIASEFQDRVLAFKHAWGSHKKKTAP